MVERVESEMVIVPGHGVCKPGCTSPSVADLDSSWVGIFPGEGPFYIEHARKAVAIAATSERCVPVFSGGQTREDAGRRSEAESYWEICAEAGWWGSPGLEARALKEEYARDSFENLLFSIALFRREARTWPAKITVVGWRFKEKRYQLHRQALKWPESRFAYVGVNDPAGEELKKALAGEKAKTDSVSRDLLLSGPEWRSQRETRDPFQRRHPYRGIDSNLDSLFDYLEAEAYRGTIPWVQR